SLMVILLNYPRSQEVLGQYVELNLIRAPVSKCLQSGGQVLNRVAKRLDAPCFFLAAACLIGLICRHSRSEQKTPQTIDWQAFRACFLRRSESQDRAATADPAKNLQHRLSGIPIA